MRRIETKEQRLALRKYEFDRMTEQGYDQETYKTLTIFINDKDGKYSLKIFRGTSTKPIQWCYYRSSEQRAQSIANYKESEDKRLAYKKECKDNPIKSTAANAAQAIRNELKENFPGVKFSVTSDTFSMGNSVDIRWEDGPTEALVKEITGKYQYGHFDGMNDMYENSNSRDDIPQAKYVSEGRKMSAQTKTILEPIAAELFKDEGENRWGGNTLYRLYQKTSIPVRATILGIERTAKDCGQMEDMYFINYQAVEQKQNQVAPAVEEITVTPGEVNIIEYGNNSIAVIGDTKPIKDKLGKNGLKGWFKFNLSCGGPGWIFPKSRLEEVKAALTQEMKSEYEITDHSEPEQKEEHNTGLIIQKEEPKEYDNLRDLENAAKSGQVVSLLNMYNLVNNKAHVQ